jgi:hypothetical protein
VEDSFENLGDLVEEWLRRSGLKPADLAQRVRDKATSEAGKTCKRQHIEQLIKAGNRLPRYIVDLERAMGAAPGDLLALRIPATTGSHSEAADGASGATVPDTTHDEHDEMHRRLLAAFDGILTTDRARFLAQIEARAAELRELSKQVLRERYGIVHYADDATVAAAIERGTGPVPMGPERRQRTEPVAVERRGQFGLSDRQRKGGGKRTEGDGT